MNDLFVGLCFVFDGLLTAVTAWLALRLIGGATKGLIEPLLGWGLMVIMLIAGPGVVLGLTGFLGRTGFMAAHAALLAVCLALRARQWRLDLADAREWLKDFRRVITGNDWIARGCIGLAILLLGLALLAALAEPLVHDALAYRLPRIGLWLSEGRISHFETADARINYMPWVSDLLAVWLLGATTSGWLLVALPQTLGGALLLVATIALGRQAGLSRAASLGAAFLVLGLANIAVQFTTAQTDLFVAGVLAAAFCLWQGAILRGRGSVGGGLGAALALGSKGTVFYVAPGLFVVVVYLAVKHRMKWRQWRLTFMGAVLGLVLWVVPAYGMNFMTYGSAFGPAESVAMHHGVSDLGWAARAEKLWINLRSSAVQLFDPHAQPVGLRSVAKTTGLRLAEGLPDRAATAPFTFQQMDRRAGLEEVLNLPNPNPDMLAVGVLPVLAFLLAVAVLGLGQRTGKGNALVLAGAWAVAVYVLAQHAIVQWHVWELRLMTLTAPWWAVTVAAGLEASPRRWRLLGWSIMFMSGLSVLWHVSMRTPQAGWQALANPQGAPSSLVESSWRRWSHELAPRGASMVLALEANRPIAAFLRQFPERRVTLRDVMANDLTVERMVAGQDGWLVTPLSQFRGREGAVYARTWINPSLSGDGYGVAAYRSLAPGESAVPVLYRNRRADTDTHAGRNLLVRTWGARAVQLAFSNPRSEACHWLVVTAAREYRGVLAAGGAATQEIALPADALAELVVLFRCPPGGLAPEVGLAP